MRTRIINTILIAGFLFAVLGVFNLSVINGKKLKELSNRNCIRLLPQPGARGKILDRSGEVIVDNYLTYDVMVMPQNEIELNRTIKVISERLGASTKDLLKRYRAGLQGTFLPVVVQKNVDTKKAIALEELKLDFPSIVIQPHPLRRYAYGNLAAHVIGYLSEIDIWRLSKLSDYGYGSKDIVGFGGVEEKYDYFLREKEGALSVEVDHRGKLVRILGYRPPENGKDILLTIDLRIQKICENTLKGRKGCVLVMEPNTGEIIALSSGPNFNPAAFINQLSPYIAGLFKDRDAPFINRAISGVFPPGSVFKGVVAAGALETGKVNLATTYTCTGSTYVGRRQFKCWDTHGPQSLIDAIAHSCDVYFYKTGILLGPQGIHDYALKFGLGKPSLIDLPYEASGFVPDPLWKKVTRLQNWYDGDTANFSIGQGDLMVTPIQMARMTAVFANGGYLVSPYIVKEIDGHSLSSYRKKSVKVPVRDSTLKYIKQGMRKVVSSPNGTASILSGVGVNLSGKTGTVQVPKGAPHGWFTGYFPSDKPRFVIVVFLENGGSGYACSVLTKQIVEEMVKQELI